ncbi:MAG: hypothetical protein P8011_03280 [Acidihalobacter sp.]|jgi:hypothetical protein|uniref:hypothetical protein n=1 Tax=Acidihalobacter sp. TaxID=1872108 RepID=UPI00307D2C5F
MAWSGTLNRDAASRPEASEFLQKSWQQIDQLVKGLNKLSEDVQDHKDTVRHIVNLWERMRENPLFPGISPALSQQLNSPDNHDANDTSNLMRWIAMFEEQATEIELFVGYVTIPERVNGWLALARPGYILPFHLVFEDELPAESSRQKVLNYLSWKPAKIIGGLVDPNAGFIYRYPRCVVERAFRHGLVILLFTAMATVFACWHTVDSVLALETPYGPINEATVLLKGWLAVCAGVLVHWLVDQGKNRQDKVFSQTRPIFPIGAIFWPRERGPRWRHWRGHSSCSWDLFSCSTSRRN